LFKTGRSDDEKLKYAVKTALIPALISPPIADNGRDK